MAIFSTNKQITNLFHDNSRAPLVHYSGDDDSLSLSHLVHSFLEENTNVNNDSVANEFDSDRVDSVDESESSTLKRLKAVFSNNADNYRNKLLEHVYVALENFAFLRERNFSIFRRSVAAFLREKGHDAAVCVTSWEAYDGTVTAGSHEFIDVVRKGSATWRYFVEIEFRAQFEIAKPTRQFSEVLNTIPGVFVGGEIEMKRSVSILCDAAKRCFRSREVSIPPWRRNRFMQNKWFAPCERTTNSVQGKPVRVTAVNSVSCRLLGFDDVVMETRRGGAVAVRTR
ncbi:uncharacterized protein LOC123892017 [Trifolium pratense]|uniref:uncharacterized protein LOC123892017 n=1 Tax=Trifolium pratense TaxID=57577 RepID=UPI001E69428B|nr:uncharacterized protein LOC123892017 [Trifolium pratense]